MTPRLRKLVIERQEQLDALTSPVRMELLDWLQAAGPSSIAELAAGLGRTTTSLYYHVNKLVELGLLVERAARRTRSRSERTYELIAERIEVTDGLDSAANAERLAGSTEALLRMAGREVRAALDAPDALAGGNAGLYAARMRGRLSARALAEVNRRVLEIQRIFAEERKRGRGVLTTMTAVVVPLPEPPQRNA